jgi:hypothetical protein
MLPMLEVLIEPGASEILLAGKNFVKKAMVLTLTTTTQALHWDRGRPARFEVH